jgi:CBS domain-containing protein
VALLLRMRAGEWWLLDREDVMRLAPDASPTVTAIRAKSKGPVPYLFPDQTLSEALAVMADWPVLPVANRANLAKLEGILTLEDTLTAFRKTPKED